MTRRVLRFFSPLILIAVLYAPDPAYTEEYETFLDGVTCRFQCTDVVQDFVGGAFYDLGHYEWVKDAAGCRGGATCIAVRPCDCIDANKSCHEVVAKGYCAISGKGVFNTIGNALESEYLNPGQSGAPGAGGPGE